ncbi:PD-(D/E)XK nuclease family protein [Xanthocytophaga agilis]|uniref:PD-(D/E)XK nuclease family protein n=1 Tax=Xanthocytophaga agilis TaxID=3048010 RepID=A0AAE3R2W2_9BACT|nr:PD-(D/E)XK nuclease family protein [Xanthocytophaga agilis]MDJ1502160.1 PD-(D/E)XK nuclease family protein [Xanthocytophaga agilis]
MNKTFLEQSAEYIFTKYHANLEQVVVILPTNRACYFFKRALAMQTDQPVWSPNIQPIDDFIAQTADAELIDPIQLLWLLFDTCRETDPKIQFDRFTSWAYTLLQDFDHIDQYMIEATQLFEYLSEAKTIERWLPDMPDGRTPQAFTNTLPNYFKLWNNLHNVYLRLKERLSEQGKGYRGMLYRRIAENLDILLDNESVYKYIFIGFNALSQSEQKIFTKLAKKGRGEILWDTDDYYMDANTNVKAGDTLRHYRNSGEFGEWNWQSHDLLHQTKNIYIIGVPNVSIQAKVAMQIYRNQLLENQTVKSNGQIQLDFTDIEEESTSAMTAIVLPDENLLMPLLNTLPAEIKDFNVTMGLSLKNSGLYTLVEALFELHHLTYLEKRDGQKTVKLSHRYITKVLTHPFIRQYDYLLQRQRNADGTEHNSYVHTILYQISFHNKVFFTADELFALSENHPFFLTLFTPWHGESQQALKCFYELIEHLRQVYQDRKDALEIEYLYLFRQMVQRLDDIMKDRAARPNAEKLTLRSFRLFLNELFRQTKIPFSGEPVSDLQIMGMLETRTLDFDTVILLSANENTLPQGKKQQSLIPFDASTQFGLPTYRTQEAVMSYHFYRLLQRSDTIYLLYTQPSDSNKNEKSRFIQQIESELVRYNPNITLHYPTVRVVENELSDVLLNYEVQKSEPILTKIRERLGEGLYPSHVNTFIECSLKYYFAHVLKLHMEEEVGETLDAGKFGDLVHKTLESLDREMSERKTAIQKEDLEILFPQLEARVRHEFENAYPDYSIESGYNHVMYKVAVRLIQNFLQQQVEENVFPVEILGLEKEMTADLQTFVHGDPVYVKLTGKIDRIDKTANQVRIIDYKTGKVEKKHLKTNGSEQEELLLQDSEAGKVRQLWLYKYIVAKKVAQDKGLQLADRHIPLEQSQLVAGIYSFRNLKDGLLEDHLQMGEGTPESFVKHSEEYLQKLLFKLLDPAQPFERTSNVKLCTMCTFKKICNR